MKFLKYIQNDKENLFVSKIKEMMMEQFELIKKVELKRNQLMFKQ
jgi:hypothetical protein